MAAKVLDWRDCARWIAARQKAGEQVVFTNGCFDLLHPGHFHLLEQARGMGDQLVVGLNSDASVRRLKGPSRPVNPLADRLAMLSALPAVSVLVVFPLEKEAANDAGASSADTPHELLRELRPAVLVKGGDYAAEDVVGREFVEKVNIVPLLPGYSSREILRRAGGITVGLPNLN